MMVEPNLGFSHVPMSTAGIVFFFVFFITPLLVTEVLLGKTPSSKSLSGLDPEANRSCQQK